MSGTILAMEHADVLAFEKAATAGGRRYSYGSVTDPDLHRKPSRGNKASKLKSEGTEMQTKDIAAEGIGVTCWKGQKPESPNQDSFVCIRFEESLRLYGVFDGHGKQGHHVSNYVKENLPKIVLGDPTYKTDPAGCLKTSFKKMQHALRTAEARGLFDCKRSGSTCTFGLHFVEEKKFVVAHVGDSRCVVSSVMENGARTEELTLDHRPEIDAERKRIEAGGGLVRFDGAFNHRVYSRKREISGPGLNMSRAFGDFHGHDHAGLSCEPDVKEYDIGPNDKYLLMCSDGVWEFMKSEQGVDVAHSCNDCLTASAKLAELAWQQWRHFDPCTVDDITAVVVDLQIVQKTARDAIAAKAAKEQAAPVTEDPVLTTNDESEKVSLEGAGPLV